MPIIIIIITSQVFLPTCLRYLYTACSPAPFQWPVRYHPTSSLCGGNSTAAHLTIHALVRAYIPVAEKKLEKTGDESLAFSDALARRLPRSTE